MKPASDKPGRRLYVKHAWRVLLGVVVLLVIWGAAYPAYKQMSWGLVLLVCPFIFIVPAAIVSLRLLAPRTKDNPSNGQPPV